MPESRNSWHPFEVPQNSEIEKRYQEELRHDFERMVNFYLSEFHAELKRKKDIRFGPQYSSQMKNGEAIALHTSIIERTDSYLLSEL